MTNQPPPAVLNDDFDTASQALAAAIENRDADTVSLALGSRFLIIKRQAAEALGDVGDNRAVPRLVEALEQNQVVYTGGSETKALQVNLNAALISTLRKLTEIDSGRTDPASDDDIRRVLETSRQWWEQNKQK
ncbi:MAG: hypothetical protein ACYTG0_08900 [Planctomycetota bacterium]|jgi:HEAT repeat protein